jgi:SnoaL-like domain
MSTATEVSLGELREAISRQQITQLLYRYCRAVDRIDEELGYTIWHDDAEVDYGRIYQGSARGLLDFICAAHRRAIVHSHQITNIILEVNGSVARSESYVTSGMRLMDGDQLKQITTRGRYLDSWSQREGRWGIERRVYVHDFDEIRTVTPAFTPPTFRLDRNDPSYAFFEEMPVARHR